MLLLTKSLETKRWLFQEIELMFENKTLVINGGRHESCKHSQATDAVVSGYMVRNEQEERCKFHQPTADTWSAQLPNSMDMVA